MGLSVVHGIVKKAKGTIAVTSEVGRGSTFDIFFPRVQAEKAQAAGISLPLATGRERILLVDDEEIQVETMRNVLERLGYKVQAVRDSAKALSLFRQDPRAFELLITAQAMPKMTGVNLIQEVLRVRPDLPVILCTGVSEAAKAKDALDSAWCELLPKPFSVQEISALIRLTLEKE